MGTLICISQVYNERLVLRGNASVGWNVRIGQRVIRHLRGVSDKVNAPGLSPASLAASPPCLLPFCPREGPQEC